MITETQRGFTVLVKEPAVQYPARGCDELTGAQALSLMETLTRRGFKVWAVTVANGIMETLELEEMRQAVI